MSDHALICCAVRTRTGEPRDQRTDLGLVSVWICFKSEVLSQIKNHAYGVTGVRKVAIGSGINAVLRREKLSLVRNMMTIKAVFLRLLLNNLLRRTLQRCACAIPGVRLSGPGPLVTGECDSDSDR